MLDVLIIMLILLVGVWLLPYILVGIALIAVVLCGAGLYVWYVIEMVIFKLFKRS